MKKKSLNKKLVLNKQTITDLNKSEMNRLNGGSELYCTTVPLIMCTEYNSCFPTCNPTCDAATCPEKYTCQQTCKYSILCCD